MGRLMRIYRDGGENQTFRWGLKNILVGEGRETFLDEVKCKIEIHQIEGVQKPIALMVIL